MKVLITGASGQLGHGNAGNIEVEPRQIEGLTGVHSISAGFLCSLAMTGDGGVLGWGNDRDGSLGLGDDVAEQRTPLQYPDLRGPASVVC